MPDAMSHLLVPTDFRPASREAVRLALEMAFGSWTRVTLLHVIPEEPLYGLDAIGYLHRILTPDASGRCAGTRPECDWSRPEADPGSDAILERLERELHPEWRRSLAIRTVVRRGDVATEIGRYVREEEVDLIVIGVDRPGWRFSLRPRQSEQIQWAADRPVLFVHAYPARAGPSPGKPFRPA